MATVFNMKGTSVPSFTIGKKGATILQGTDAPDAASGKDGDIYIQHGNYPGNLLWIKRNGSWVQFQIQNARLDELATVTPAANSFLGTDANGVIIRNAAQSRTALGLGTAAVANTGVNPGNIPILDATGKLAASTMPEIAITRVKVVSDAAARDALEVEEGDVSITTTDQKMWIYDGSAWRLIGTQGTVSSIMKSDGSTKSGVVSLDASDILSGVFPTARGGTGLSTYNVGDLLVGGASSTLTKLAIGTEGQILMTTAGKPAWGWVSSANAVFTPNAAHHIDATNVQDAIVEVASERTFIKTSTSNPTNSDDVSAGYKPGDLWINTNTNRVFIATSTSASSAVWSESGVQVQPQSIVYVAANGSDTAGDGSANRPYSSVAKAATVAVAGTVILVAPGTYTSAITLTGLNKVSIVGMGPGAKIVGKLTLNNCADFLIQGMDLENNATSSALEIGAGSKGRVHDCSLTRPAVTDVAALVIGGIAGSVDFSDVRGQGVIRNQATQSYAVRVTGSNADLLSIDAQSGLTILANCSTFGSVTHSGGAMYVSNVQTVVKDSSTGRSIVSSATNLAANFISLTNVGLKQGDGTYGSFYKPGDCAYSINSSDWNTTDTLAGTRSFQRFADDISANRTSTHYSAANSSIRSHLAGIDNKFGQLTFAELTDTPNSFTGSALKFVRVKGAEDGVEFATASFLDLTDTPSGFAAAQGDALKVVRVNASGNALEFGPTLSSIAVSGKFTSLTDAPTSYTGQGGKAVRVNTSATGLEFFSIQAGDVGGLASVATAGTFLSLTDTPSSFVGHGLKLLRVDATGTSVEFGPVLGTAAVKDIGTAAGQVPVLDSNGKLATSVLPSLAITDVYVVSTIAERDALLVQGGDVAKVTGTGETFIYDGSQWVLFSSPDAVRSVNSKAGDVVLDATDISAARSPSQYSVSGSSIKAHLDGIDLKFGTLGSVATKNVGTAAGQIPVLDSNGKLADSVIPEIALTRVYEVTDIDALNALETSPGVQEGDIAKITGGSTYIRKASGAWMELSAPVPVLSVNGYTGQVVLNGIKIDSTYSPTNYVAVGATLDAHFSGIDNKLAEIKADAITDISQDTAPVLGGDLDVNGKKIFSATNVVLESGDANWVSVNGVQFLKKKTVTVLDDQSVAQIFLSVSAEYEAIFVDYVAKRPGFGQRVGTLMVTNDGASVEFTDTGADLGNNGIEFSLDLVDGNIEFSYTSTMLGAGGSIAYSVRRFAI